MYSDSLLNKVLTELTVLTNRVNCMEQRPNPVYHLDEKVIEDIVAKLFSIELPRFKEYGARRVESKISEDIRTLKRELNDKIDRNFNALNNVTHRITPKEINDMKESFNN